ncbi:MAG: hypothetical protein P4M07_28530 [Xanthobacteraceae bacterium]|nr:hypothetical protein [Xanthobacteraceae bacterium]
MTKPLRSRDALALVLMIGICGHAFAPGAAAADDDDAPKSKPALPTTYLDLQTSYTTLPAGVLALGFGTPGQLATLPTFGLPASRSLGVNAPLTIDLDDRVSIYGGIHASTVQVGSLDWTAFAIDSWNIGTQIDVYKQNGGLFPTVTVQETVSRATSTAPSATTSFTTIVEFDEALNKDATRGLLAGMQAVNVLVDSPLGKVNPYLIGYAGAYYEWDNDWKITGRAGVQSFGGAQLLGLSLAQPFTQPLVRFDLDLLDDNDNRLFGVWAQVAWTPKPSYLLTLRTPLYAVRNK